MSVYSFSSKKSELGSNKDGHIKSKHPIFRRMNHTEQSHNGGNLKQVHHFRNNFKSLQV